MTVHYPEATAILQLIVAVGCITFAMSSARFLNPKKPRVHPLVIFLTLVIAGAMMIWPLIFLINANSQ